MSVSPVGIGLRYEQTPRFLTEISAGGMYDTSSIDKAIRAVVTVTYGLD